MKFRKLVELIFSSNLVSVIMLILLSCTEGNGGSNNKIESEDNSKSGEMQNHLTTENYVRDIVSHTAFKGFGELLLPNDNIGEKLITIK
jgi:hypothetical protein